MDHVPTQGVFDGPEFSEAELEHMLHSPSNTLPIGRVVPPWCATSCAGDHHGNRSNG